MYLNARTSLPAVRIILSVVGSEEENWVSGLIATLLTHSVGIQEGSY